MRGYPAVRAAHSKHTIGRIKRLDGAASTEILRRIESARALVRQAGPLEWLPAEHQVHIADSIADVLSVPLAKHFWRDLLLDSFDRPLVRPFAAGAVRVYDHDPASFVRMAPLVWKAVLRHCGEADVLPEENGAYVRFHDLPPLLYQSVGMSCFCEGAMACTYVHFGCEGEVRRTESARPDELCYQMRWKRQR